MTSASEEHRDAEVAFQIVSCLLFAEKIDIEQVIAEIEVQCHRVVQQEAVTRPKVDGKAIVACERRRAKTGDQVQIGVIGTPFTEEHFARQDVVADIQVVIRQRAFVCR